MTGAAGLLPNARVSCRHRVAVDLARHCIRILLFLLHMKLAECGGAWAQRRLGAEVKVLLGTAARSTPLPNDRCCVAVVRGGAVCEMVAGVDAIRQMGAGGSRRCTGDGAGRRRWWEMGSGGGGDGGRRRSEIKLQELEGKEPVGKNTEKTVRKEGRRVGRRGERNALLTYDRTNCF